MHTRTDEVALGVGDGFISVQRNEIDEPVGRCLLVPPFGLTARTMAPIAQALGSAGLDVVSFDPRNHVGGGSGTIADFKLSTVADDCLAAINHFEPTCVVAVSLGARAAIRALAQTDATPTAVLLTPVVDVRATLIEVLERDLFALAPQAWPSAVPVLGSVVNAPGFLHDCDQLDLVDTEGTVRDLGEVAGQVTLIPGSDDPWVSAAAVQAVADRTPGPSTVKPVECHLHAFHEDAELAMRLIGAMIEIVVDAHAPAGSVA